MLGLVIDTRRDKVLEDNAVDEGMQECYLCKETVLVGADYQVHLTTAHEEVHVKSAVQKVEDDVIEEEVLEEDVIEEDVIEEDVIEDEVLDDDVIEDPVACYLCGESVLPGQDYKVHLAAAHKLTKVQIEQ